MNAAFVLFTSAIMIAQEPPKPMPEKVEAPPAAAAPATPAPVVVHPAPAPITYSPECGCAESSGCCEREGLFARMRKWFSKGDDCGCGCETTVHVAPKVHHHAAPCDCDPCTAASPACSTASAACSARVTTAVATPARRPPPRAATAAASSATAP